MKIFVFVYVLKSKNKFVIISLHVDDILLVSNDKSFVDNIKTWLSSKFDMKDLGEVAYTLGVKILRDKQKWLLALSQELYNDKILERLNM